MRFEFHAMIEQDGSRDDDALIGALWAAVAAVPGARVTGARLVPDENPCLVLALEETA